MSGKISASIFLFIILLIVFSGCKEEALQKPGIFLDTEKMIEIITDLQINNAIVLNQKSLAKESDTLSKILADSVFKKHNIQKTTFDSNMHWYLNDPKQVEIIYDAVLSKLQQIQLEKTGNASDPE